MGILGLLVKDGHSAVHMVLLDIAFLAPHQVKENALPHISQITGHDPVIVIRRTPEVLHVPQDGITRRRRHTRPHILGIFQSIINDLTYGHTGDPHMAPPGSYKKRRASRNRPLCGQRALIRISQRKTELLLRTSKVTGSHGKHHVAVSCRHTHGGKGQSLP